MTDRSLPDDPTTALFWEAALKDALLYSGAALAAPHSSTPRPFCLACESTDLAWADASGNGVVHSVTTNRLQVSPDMEPPYVVALVELDEGPRVMTHVDGEVAIDDRVRVEWRERADALPILVAIPD